MLLVCHYSSHKCLRTAALGRKQSEECRDNLHTEWEKVFVNYISNRALISRIYLGHYYLQKLNTKNNPNHPVSKWAIELNRQLKKKEEIQMANKYLRRQKPNTQPP